MILLIKMNRLCLVLLFVTSVLSNPVHLRSRVVQKEDKGISFQTRDDGDDDTDDDSHSHLTQYLHHIMEQVQQSHVTQNKVNDWKDKLNHALQTGLLTHEKYQDFLHNVKSELMSQSANNRYCSSCMFWVG